MNQRIWRFAFFLTCSACTKETASSPSMSTSGALPAVNGTATVPSPPGLRRELKILEKDLEDFALVLERAEAVTLPTGNYLHVPRSTAELIDRITIQLGSTYRAVVPFRNDPRCAFNEKITDSASELITVLELSEAVFVRSTESNGQLHVEERVLSDVRRLLESVEELELATASSRQGCRK